MPCPQAAELGKQRRKRDSKAGFSNGNGMYSASSEQSEDAVRGNASYRIELHRYCFICDFAPTLKNMSCSTYCGWY